MGDCILTAFLKDNNRSAGLQCVTVTHLRLPKDENSHAGV